MAAIAAPNTDRYLYYPPKKLKVDTTTEAGNIVWQGASKQDRITFFGPPGHLYWGRNRFYLQTKIFQNGKQRGPDTQFKVGSAAVQNGTLLALLIPNSETLYLDALDGDTWTRIRIFRLSQQICAVPRFNESGTKFIVNLSIDSRNQTFVREILECTVTALPGGQVLATGLIQLYQYAGPFTSGSTTVSGFSQHQPQTLSGVQALSLFGINTLDYNPDNIVNETYEPEADSGEVRTTSGAHSPNGIAYAAEYQGDLLVIPLESISVDFNSVYKTEFHKIRHTVFFERIDSQGDTVATALQFHYSITYTASTSDGNSVNALSLPGLGVLNTYEQHSTSNGEHLTATTVSVGGSSTTIGDPVDSFSENSIRESLGFEDVDLDIGLAQYWIRRFERVDGGVPTYSLINRIFFNGGVIFEKTYVVDDQVFPRGITRGYIGHVVDCVGNVLIMNTPAYWSGSSDGPQKNSINYHSTDYYLAFFKKTKTGYAEVSNVESFLIEPGVLFRGLQNLAVL